MNQKLLCGPVRKVKIYIWYCDPNKYGSKHYDSLKNKLRGALGSRDRTKQYYCQYKISDGIKFSHRYPNSKSMFPPGLEPGTFRVLGERDNHYTTETCLLVFIIRLNIILWLAPIL